MTKFRKRIILISALCVCLVVLALVFFHYVAVGFGGNEGGACLSVSFDKAKVDRVAFHTAYPHAVIWSPNGKKPSFFLSPDETNDIYCEKLSFFYDKWFHCIKT